MSKVAVLGSSVHRRRCASAGAKLVKKANELEVSAPRRSSYHVPWKHVVAVLSPEDEFEKAVLGSSFKVSLADVAMVLVVEFHVDLVEKIDVLGMSDCEAQDVDTEHMWDDVVPRGPGQLKKRLENALVLLYERHLPE